MTSSHASPAKLREDLLAQLPATARDAVDQIVAAAAPHAVYAVAGAVRDLILGREMVDLDLVMECDAPTILRAALPDAKPTVHARFRTASCNIAGLRIDVATSRSETYARPGALPRVTPASMDEDLRRRDFAMNAIAIRLSGEPTLLDPCDGIADIAARRIRVLHDASFQDDATRIFRALRYAARLNFAIDRHTRDLMTRDVDYIDTIGGERLRRELELILGEATGGKALEAASQHRVIHQVHPAMSWDEARTHALTDPPAPRVPKLPYGFALLAAHASPEEAAAIATRLKLKRDESEAVKAITSMSKIAATLRRPDAKPSGVVVLLDRFPLAAVAARAAVESDPIARQLALRYLAEWRNVRPILRGDELIELGVPAGPQVQRGLQLIRAARLDGWATDRDDERALTLRFAKSIRDAGARHAPIEFNLN
jgi:tRNA nucleotidyltransferase (CCA-adding enzyme)